MNPRFSLMTRLLSEDPTPPVTTITFPNIEERPLHYTITGNDGERKSIGVEGAKALINPDTDTLYSIVTNKYQTIPYVDSLQMVEEAIQSNPEFGRYERSVDFLNRGGRMLAKYRFIDHTIPIGRGDMVNPEIIVKRSYDSTWGFVLLFGAFRIVCANGLVVGEKLLEYQHKHTIGLDQNILLESLNGAMDKFAVQADLWNSWLDRMTTSEDYEKVMDTMMFGKKHTKAIEDVVEMSSEVTMDDIRTKTLSYWLFFNIISQYVTHQVKSPIRQEFFFDKMRTAFK